MLNQLRNLKCILQKIIFIKAIKKKKKKTLIPNFLMLFKLINFLLMLLKMRIKYILGKDN